MENENIFPIDLTTKKIKRRRSSFFNLETKKTKEEVNKDVTMEKEKHIERLEKEQTDWVSFIRKQHNKAKENAKELPVKLEKESEVSALSKERQEYLAQAPDLKAYVDDLEEFQNRVIRYVMRKEWIGIRLKDYQERIDGSLMEVANLKLSQ